MSVVVTHNAGFFSCCSVKLTHIVYFINVHKKFPTIVDSSKQFDLYKVNDNKEDITFEYFEHPDNCHVELDKNIHINYIDSHQFHDYSQLDYNSVLGAVAKYFTPSTNIRNIINNMEEKYKLEYENICVLFYRGNDKNRETEICEYNDYIIYANFIISKNPNIKFLIQSDETEFIELMTNTYPDNSFYFKDEIRHMNKCDHTVDFLMRDQISLFSKYYLAITIIMSKCKYIICGTGNCSMWIMFYRGNYENVYQNNNKRWVKEIS
jgi:hypothetical protein